MTVTERILEEIKVAESAGVTRYRIAQDTGISEASLCRIVSGATLPASSTIDLLADYFGLELRPIHSSKPNPSSRRMAKRRK